MFKRLAPNRRVVVGQDSRVNLGSLGKGRSPSDSLNRLMRSEAPWILGKNLYVAGVHFPTRSIRADCPSRCVPVFPPRSFIPPWLWALRSGNSQAGLCLDDLEGLPRSYNRWFLFASVLLQRGASASPQTLECSYSDKGFDRERSNHCQDLHSANVLVGQPAQVVGGTRSRLHPRRVGSFSYRQFVKVVGRVYGSFISMDIPDRWLQRP